MADLFSLPGGTTGMGGGPGVEEMRRVGALNAALGLASMMPEDAKHDVTRVINDAKAIETYLSTGK